LPKATTKVGQDGSDWFCEFDNDDNPHAHAVRGGAGYDYMRGTADIVDDIQKHVTVRPGE
jgi:hypothetical protein